MGPPYEIVKIFFAFPELFSFKQRIGGFATEGDVV